MYNRIRYILLGIGVSLLSSGSFASEATAPSPAGNRPPAGSEPVKMAEIKEERESLFPNAGRSLAMSHFSWGAEFGASIDLSGYNTSTFNVDALFGYKNDWFKILGAGVGVHRSFGNGDNFIPVYAVVRTSFSPAQRLFFMSLKLGYSFNTIGDSPMFGDTNTQVGAGINLAVSRKFQSHIVLAYEFRHFNKRHKYVFDDRVNNISLATISFGVNF